MKAVFFCEDDYEGCADVADEAEFNAFARGFIRGAMAYDGEGVKIAVYLLPQDHARMVEEQHVGEVMRALEATDPTFSAPLPPEAK